MIEYLSLEVSDPTTQSDLHADQVDRAVSICVDIKTYALGTHKGHRINKANPLGFITNPMSTNFKTRNLRLIDQFAKPMNDTALFHLRRYSRPTNVLLCPLSDVGIRPSGRRLVFVVPGLS